MAPIWLAWLASSSAAHLLGREAAAVADPDTTPISSWMRAQWQNPGDILSVLLLLGPDVIQRAIAQLAGRAITPVAFSFGWVAYAVSALLSSFGDGRLMPESETSFTVLDTNSGHFRVTRNWVLGRLLRDFNDRLNKEMMGEQAHISSNSHDKEGRAPPTVGLGKGTSQANEKRFEALRVTVFEVDDNPPAAHGVPTLDWVWYSGIAVMLLQLGVAAVPWAVNGAWDIFMVTAAGNLLALVGSSLPQWRREKWACPKVGGDTAAITEGNGSRSAMLILGKKGAGLKLEVLARGTRMAPATLVTRVASTALAVLWVLFLITVAAMKEHTWYLLGIGLAGSIQNLLAAGVRRSPSALGIHIKQVDVIRARYVSETLRQVEAKYPLAGTALLSVFFPGSMRISRERPDDMSFWRAALDARYRENKHGIRLDRLPPVSQKGEPRLEDSGSLLA